MRYSQQQVLTILRLDQSTFVYWMRAHPRIARLKGRGCHFTRSDIITLGVLALASRELGCAIGSLGPLVDDLFATVDGLVLGELEGHAILIGVDAVLLRRQPILLEDTRPVAVVPLDPLIERIVSWDERDQYDLPF